MALPLPQVHGERMSRILPTVKCSDCNLPVALAELGDHVCAPPPPTPSTPRPSAILANIRKASQSIPQRIPSPSPRSQTPTSTRSKTPQPAQSSPPSPSPSPSPVAVPPLMPSTPAPGRAARQPSPSLSRSQTPPTPRAPGPPSRFDPPSRSATPQAQMPPSTPRSGMGSRFDTLPRSAAPAGRFDTLPRSATTASARRPSVSSVSSTSRMHVPFAPEPPNSIPSKAPNTSQNPNPMSRSPPGPPPPRPSMDMPPRLSMDRPGSARPSMDGIRMTSPLGPGPSAQRSPPSPMGRPGGNPDGEVVNMAGVGRRGFQAAAHAAMIAAGFNNSQPPVRIRSPPSGMDGRRLNAPRHLNINADVTKHQASTSLSPNTPLSSHSPYSPSPPSPNTFPQPAIASSRTPSPINMPFSALSQPIPPKSPDSMSSNTTGPRSPAKSRFSARFNSKDLEISTMKPAPRNETPPSPSESDYSGGGLAYDQETESVVSPTSLPTSPPISKTDSAKDKVLFPSFGSPPRSAIGLPTRSASSASSYSHASRSTAKSTGALDRSLDTLFEGPRSPPLPAMPLSPTVKSPKLPMRSRTAPAMSTKGGVEGGLSTRRPRQCTRCNKSIDDGRWVRAEGAGVLCERCWKTMYLPKCRRCNRPIEKQAVSSADGQLKGKYHRECFNCYKCQQPFPDKEFYVFDGKPFCRYHYHEANDSLCADPECGQPIEGACAVAHTGERYHPEHLLCMYRMPRGQHCMERLEEYWEVDGLMLCEKHANMVQPAPNEEEEADAAAELGQDAEGLPSLGELGARLRSSIRHSDPDVRAQRRKTQFIDLR